MGVDRGLAAIARGAARSGDLREARQTALKMTLALGGSSVESQEYARFRAFEIQAFPSNKGRWFEGLTTAP